MTSIRRSITALIATVFAVFGSNTPAFARPAPLIGPEQGAGTVTPQVNSGGILDGWLQVSVSLLVAAAIVAVVVATISRVRPHLLSHA